MGVVTAHIVEEGNDVRVSFSGSISLDETLARSEQVIVNFVDVVVRGDTLLVSSSG